MKTTKHILLTSFFVVLLSTSGCGQGFDPGSSGSGNTGGNGSPFNLFATDGGGRDAGSAVPADGGSGSCTCVGIPCGSSNGCGGTCQSGSGCTTSGGSCRTPGAGTCSNSSLLFCGGDCCDASHPFSCDPPTGYCYATAADAQIACGSACTACVSQSGCTSSCVGVACGSPDGCGGTCAAGSGCTTSGGTCVSSGPGSCPQTGEVFCGTVCCHTAYPYFCAATQLCYASESAAQTACGSASCVACQ